MNIIRVPINHQMFFEDIHVEISNFIYDEFGIIFEDSENVYSAYEVKYNPSISGTCIAVIFYQGELVDGSVQFEIEFNELRPCGFDVLCNKNEEKWLNIGYDIASLILIVIAYIMSSNRKRLYKEKTINKRHKSEKDINSNQQLNDKIYLLDDLIEYVDKNRLNKNEDSGHEIQCPCWSVRGHYRHYKSGKTIFIKNYLKGKEKDGKKPKYKEYIV